MTVTVKAEQTEIEIIQSYLTSDEQIENEITKDMKIIIICCTIAVVITLISVLVMLRIGLRIRIGLYTNQSESNDIDITECVSVKDKNEKQCLFLV